jgi:hypothetical protein
MSQRTNTQPVFDRERVRNQVDRILASEGFVRSPRMRRFLQFIVEEALAGRADQLSEYTIGTAVFDRGEDFEPGLDPIVRNDARRLRLKLLEYYRRPGPRQPDDLHIEMPKGGYVPAFLPLDGPAPFAPVGVPMGSGERFRVVVNLVRATDGAQVWAGEFELNAEELMGLLPAGVTAQVGLRRPQPGRLALAA